jgi:hypothetical protein
MTRKTSRFAALLASAAAFSMMATPAFANHGWGWGGRHRDRVDAGDVITGILIIGGIAAIASAASSNNKKKRYERRSDDDRYEDDRYERDDNRDYSRDSRPEWQEGSGINGAINRCMTEVSRGSNRVEEVDSVNRDGDGWRVQGRSSAGNFICSIDQNGRIRNVEVG